MITPERWAQIKELFEVAVEQTPEERSTALDRLCHGNDDLRGEVERLLAQRL